MILATNLVPNYTYIIQRKPDITNEWEDMQSALITNTFFECVDTQRLERAFYRVMLRE